MRCLFKISDKNNKYFGIKEYYNKLGTLLISNMKISGKFLLHILCFLNLATGLSAQTSDINIACAPVTINFQPPAGFSNWFWDFKDLATSNLSAPDHLFTTPGKYNVEFKETQNGPIIGTVLITILAKPDLQPSIIPTNGCPPLNVSFNDQTTYESPITVNSFSWTFGDGGYELIKNPDHLFEKPGKYSISLEVKTNIYGCDVTKIFPDKVTVFELPKPLFNTIPDPPTTCNPPFEVKFINNSTGTPNLTYNWNFGNSVTFNGKDAPPQTYVTKGSFVVTLNVTDGNGCKNEVKDTVNVGSNQIKISFPDTICLGDTIKFLNTSPSGFHAWEFGPNADLLTSKTRSPKIIFNKKGLQTIKYKLSFPSTDCFIDTLLFVYVDHPEPTFQTIIPEHCEAPINIQYIADEDNVSYKWRFSKNITSNTKVVNLLYPKDPNNYSVYGKRPFNAQLIVISDFGCRDSLLLVDTLHLLTAAYFLEPYDACVPFEIQFNDYSYSKQPIKYWHWYFGDGTDTIIYNNKPFFHTYDTCGFADTKLVIENELGCKDTSYITQIPLCGCEEGGFGSGGLDSIKIIFTEPPCIGCDPDSNSICHGDTLFFLPVAGPYVKEFRWESDKYRMHHCTRDSLIFCVYDHEPGYHDIKLTVVSIFGDTITNTWHNVVNVKGPWPRPNYMINCNDPLNVMFTDTSKNATSIKWDFPDGFTSSEKVFNHKFDSSGDYTVRLTAINDLSGCPNQIENITVHVRNLKADYLTSQTDYCKGDKVPLDASVSNDVNGYCYKGYTWYFSDGSRPLTYGTPDAEFKFTKPGKKTILLEVTDINGCKDTASHSIYVNEVKANFNIPKGICLPDTVLLTDNSSFDRDTIISWIWTVNGKIYSHARDTFISYKEGSIKVGDTVFVKLTVESKLGCNSFFRDTLIIYKPTSLIEIEPLDDILCTNEKITFTGTDYLIYGSFLNFSWDFGNGTTSDQASTSISYQDEGTYNVKLLFTENSSGCTDSLFKKITVQAKPFSNFLSNVDSSSVICYPSNVLFTNLSTSKDSLSYFWDFGNGTTSTFQDPGIVFNKGVFNTTLIVITPAGCSDTSYHQYTIYGPEGNFDFDKNQICLGDSLTLSLKDTVDVGNWLWDFGDGSIQSGGTTATHQYTFLPPGKQTVAKLLLSDPTEVCKYTVEKILPIVNTKADFDLVTEDSIFCLGGKLNLINKSTDADVYTWFINGSFYSNQESPTYTMSVQGLQTVQLIATNTIAGCEDTIVKQFLVEPFTIAALFGDTICQGDTALIGALSDGAGIIWNWTPTKDLFTPGLFQTKAIPSKTTEYTVTAIQQAGCEVMGKVEVHVFEPYSGFLQWDTSVVKGSPVTLTIPKLDSAFNYIWIPSEGLSCDKCPNPNFIADTTLIYTLIITDDSGCFHTEVRYKIQVSPTEIKLPNVFTPNGDDHNDHFQIFVVNGGISDIGILKFKVYSRWGQLVYDNGDPQKGWDGNFKGKPCPSDVYVYVIEVAYFNGKNGNYTGEITLVR